MEKITTQSSEEILKKAKNAVENMPNKEEVEASTQRLEVPFKKLDYEERGHEEIEVSGGTLELKYALVEDYESKSLNDYIEYKTHNVSLAQNDPESKVAEWRAVVRLRYKKGDKSFDLLKLLPVEYKVFFCPNATRKTGSVMSSKDIFILGDIATPKSLLILFHELGHIWDNFKLQLMNKKHLVNDHKYSDFAETLRQERVATAFAIKNLRPFMDDETQRRDVINFLKNDALLSYHEGTDLRIKDQEYLERIITHGGDWEPAIDDDFDFYYSSFEKWKKTPKYEELKSEFLLPGTHPDEEFSAWRDWVENTKYEFWKDLPNYEE